MKKAFAILVQFAVFFVVFLGGSLADPFKLRWFVSHPTPVSTRWFVPDGLILMVILYVVAIAIEAVTKRLNAASLTSAAFALALIFGLLSKFGWATHDLF